MSSGPTRYLVRESPDQIAAGLRSRLRAENIAFTETATARGLRLALATPQLDEGLSIPAFEIGVVELRFEARGGATQVTLWKRRARRWWTLGLFAGLGLASVLGDLLAAMGFLTIELIRSMRAIQARHRADDPRVLHAVTGFLGPRDIGRLDAAPFRALSR